MRSLFFLESRLYGNNLGEIGGPLFRFRRGSQDGVVNAQNRFPGGDTRQHGEADQRRHRLLYG